MPAVQRVAAFHFRRLEVADTPAASAMFYRSMYDYLHRFGLVDAASAENPPIEKMWLRRRAWWEHLTATAAEDWVAADEAGQIVGWPNPWNATGYST